MNGYLGEFSVDLERSQFAEWTPVDWALYFIVRYGSIDGDRHKTWVLDQVTRILNHSPVRVVQARWDNGHDEYRVTVGNSSIYQEWVAQRRADGDDWDEGLAP
jgi:hypothetical protein